MRNDYVTAKPRTIDWAEEINDDGEGFKSFEWIECDCGHSLLMEASQSGEQHRYIQDIVDVLDDSGEAVDEEDNRCTAEVHFEGPQMNYFYECDWNDTEEAAKAIKNLPLCLIELRDGTKGMALTGGGMDLSWEICAAYVALGYLPPVHFAGDLPSMAWGPSKPSYLAAVLDAADRSCEIAVLWAQHARDRVTELRNKLQIFPALKQEE